MPLETAPVGSPGFGRNVATEIKAGKPEKQAVAIAYSKARGDADRSKLETRIKALEDRLGLATERRKKANGYHKSTQSLQEMKLRAELNKLRGELYSAAERKDAGASSDIEARYKQLRSKDKKSLLNDFGRGHRINSANEQTPKEDLISGIMEAEFGRRRMEAWAGERKDANAAEKKPGDTVTYTKGGKTYKTKVVKAERKNGDIRYELSNAGYVYHSDLDSPEKGGGEGGKRRDATPPTMDAIMQACDALFERADALERRADANIKLEVVSGGRDRVTGKPSRNVVVSYGGKKEVILRGVNPNMTDAEAIAYVEKNHAAKLKQARSL